MSKFKTGTLAGALILALAYSFYACDTNDSVKTDDKQITSTSTPTGEVAPVFSDNASSHRTDMTDSPVTTKDSTKDVTSSGKAGPSDDGSLSESGSDKPVSSQSCDNQKPGNGNTTDKPAKTDAPTPSPTPVPATKAPATEKPSTAVPTIATKKPTKKPTEKPTPKPTQTPEVIIPTIYSVDTPGNDVYANDDRTVKVDASNTSKGYIAIKYSGSCGKVKIIISKGDDKYTYNVTKTSYEYFPLSCGNGTYSVGVYENVSGNNYMPVFQENISVSLSDSDSPFLYPNQYVWFTQNSAVVKKSAQVCAGCESDFEKISSIFDYVTSNISYDYDKASSVTSGYLPDISSILSSKKGICFDYASVFAAMCRAQGIPTKLATGYVNQNSSMVYHAWNYVYTQEKGWVTVSFYLNKKGYNLVDATFYSTISDKESAADFINDNSNYQAYQYY